MINKLRRQFIGIAMLSVTLVILLMAAAINVFNYLSVDSSVNDTLRMLSENQGNIPQFTGGKHGKFPKGQFSPETPFFTRYFVLYYNEEGSLTRTDMRHIAAVTEEDVGSYLSAAVARGEGMGYIRQYKYSVTPAGDGQYMAIFLDCQRELHSLRRFALSSLLVSAVCVVLVYALIWFFSKKAIIPAVKNAERQKQFITDASHELKTPLTVIATSLKVLEMEVGQQKWIEKARTQTEKMSELVQSLVTLARLDEENPPVRFADFDIGNTVAETAESFRDFAMAEGHTLETEAAPGYIYRGDEYAVRQLVSVLLDNAVKYADEGGAIRLSLEKAKRGYVLRVSNPCAGIDARELDKLFDRFYRPDHSRSKQTGGFGVGLSIARSIAEIHKGSIRAEYTDGGTILLVALLK